MFARRAAMRSFVTSVAGPRSSKDPVKINPSHHLMSAVYSKLFLFPEGAVLQFSVPFSVFCRFPRVLQFVCVGVGAVEGRSSVGRGS